MRARTVALARRGGLRVVIAAFAAAAAAATSSDSSAAPSGTMPQQVGEGEGELNLIAWAGYVEDGSTDPKVDWVSRLREADRLPGQRQDRQHLGRDGDADADRPVRRRLGVGRRDRCG